MYQCVICRFSVELDDAVAPIAGGQCVCLRCYARETESEHPMPKELRKDLLAALSEVDAPNVTRTATFGFQG